MGGTRLLVALAHPDDETFICGGGLASFARAGGEVHLVCATRGEHGRRLGKPPFATRESLPVVREAETREACAALGITGLIFLGLRDKCLEFEDTDSLAARVAEHIRLLRPDGLLTFHERRGGHSDHCTIGRAATLAWERAGDASWHPEHAGAPFQPPRLYWLAGRDVFEHPERHGTAAQACTAVDSTAVAEQIMRAHRAHRTQTQLDGGLWEHEDKVVARFAGRREVYQQANAPYAEGERGLLGLQA